MNIKRYVAVFAGVLLQSCLGGIYAFSAYVPELQRAFSYTFGQTQLVFGLTVLVMTLSMIGAGRLFVLWGPRICVAISGIFYITGHLTASLAGGIYPIFLISFTALIGSAIGFGYVCPLAVGIGWFPKKKGLITGLAVAGYGGGAIFQKTLVEALFSSGYSILETFRIVGFVYGGIILFCSLLFFSPPPGDSPKSEIKVKEVLKKRIFFGLSLSFLFGTLPGLMIIGNLKPLGLSFGLPESSAAAAIITVAIGNAAGRLGWGAIHDHAQPRRTLLVLLFAVSLSSLLLLFFHGTPLAFFLSSFFFGFAYGGNLSIFPAQTAIVYHPSNLSRIYPFVLLSHGLAGAIGAPLGGWFRDITGSFDVTIIAAAICGVIGFLIYNFSTKDAQELMVSQHKTAS